MIRLLSLAAVLALAAVLFMLPDADVGSLAAMEAADPDNGLVTQTFVIDTPTGALPNLGEVALGWALLNGPHVARDDEAGLATLSLGRLEVRGSLELERERVEPVLRRSIVRGLRALAAAGQPLRDAQGEPLLDEDGEARIGPSFTLNVAGEAEPVAAGAELILWLGAEPGSTAAQGAVPVALSYENGEPPAGATTRRITARKADWHPPSSTALVPPLVAIALAVLLRKPVIALLLGVFAGAALVRVRTGASTGAALGSGAVDMVRDYFYTQLVDSERYLIVGFVVAMLAMVGLLTRIGGIRGLMDSIAGLAGSFKSSQVAAYLMGLVIFFDDYANTILVGATMRPLTDRFHVAREKLAYIVDSTAAPVAGLSVLSTWIAYEVSTFSAQLPAAGLTPGDGYAVFLQTLPYRFYCVFTLVFVALVVATGRDFGPMRVAMLRARHKRQLVREGGRPMVSAEATALEPAPGITPRAWYALLPVLTFLGVVLFEIARVGGAFAMEPGALFTIEGLTEVLYNGSGSRPLFIGSSVGFLLAAAIAVSLGLASDIPRAAWTTIKSMGVAIAILYLAWMIGAVCKRLDTASYLTVLVGDTLPPLALPSILFLLAGFVALATGSSWSTMSILLPLVVGLAYGLGETTELGGHLLMLLSIGAVLEGAIFGDHCSPISDTTVLSSVACASDHVDHVRTQAPYALLTMLVAMVTGYLPCAFLGWSPWAAMALGTAVLAGFLFAVGRTTPAEPTARA